MAKKGSNNTILVVALIFAVLVALVAIGLNIKSASDRRMIDAKTEANKVKTEAYKSQAAELLKQRDEAWKIVSGEVTDPGKYSDFKKNAFKNGRTDLEAILASQWVAKEDANLIRDKNISKVWNELRDIKESVQEHDGLNSLNKDLLKRVKILLHLIPRLRIKRKQKIDELDSAVKQFDEDRNSLNEVINDENQKLQAVNDKMLEEARQFDDAKRQLQDDLERMRKDQETRERIANLEIVKLRSEIQNLEQDIRELVKEVRKTLDVIGSDGEVVFADPTLGFAWINLGKEHKVMAGMVFDVYRKIKGGRTHLKGKIIVKSIEENMAKATIIKGAKMFDPVDGTELTLPRKSDPIVKGDLIRSPLYDKDEPQRFVLLGKKASNNLFRKEELAIKIEQAGGKVDKTVGVGTKFVVLLPNSNEDFPDEIEKAAQFGVIFLQERELVNYLSR